MAIRHHVNRGTPLQAGVGTTPVVSHPLTTCRWRIPNHAAKTPERIHLCRDTARPEPYSAPDFTRGWRTLLSVRTFRTLPREFSSFGRQGLHGGHPDAGRHSCLDYSLNERDCDPPASLLHARAQGVLAVGTIVTRPRQWARMCTRRRSVGFHARPRAAAARDAKSAGIASPVPKYISSGVCPRNAECGSTRLC